MESVLIKKANLALNKQFIENYKTEKTWISLTITEQYCRDENTGKDYYYKLPHEEFKRIIQQQKEGIL